MRQLYDLSADPKERTNSFDIMLNRNASMVSALQRQLRIEMEREGHDRNSAALNGRNGHQRGSGGGPAGVKPRGGGHDLPQDCVGMAWDSGQFMRCLRQRC